MSDLPKRYTQMKRSKLNELAVAGDEHAREALVIHQQLDVLTDRVEGIAKKIERLK